MDIQNAGIYPEKILFEGCGFAGCASISKINHVDSSTNDTAFV